MATVLQESKGVVYYLDNLLITGVTWEEHTQNLKNVLSRFQKFGLRLNEAKCKILPNFLGHVFTPTGISPTEQRVDNILQAPTPRIKSQLRSFLGLMIYNAKFIPSVVSVLHCIHYISYSKKMCAGSGL